MMGVSNWILMSAVLGIANEREIGMDNVEKRANFLTQRLEQLKTKPELNPQQIIERDRQLRQSMDIVNELINMNSHRPESVRLLRKILRERAELQIVRERDKTRLSG